MKTLSERIAQAVNGQAPYSNRAIVLGLREEIQKALDDGWSILAMYQTLYEEGTLTFSYQAFRRHVNRIFLQKTDVSAKHRPKRPASNTGTPAKPSVDFSFNASRQKEP
jgi:hypothetical protein